MIKQVGVRLLFLSSILWLSACTSTPDVRAPSTSSTTTTNKNAPVRPAAKRATILSMLQAQPAAWRGTRYKMGGTDRGGIDCSGFVHVTFRDQVGRPIPRSTNALATHGRGISRAALRTGDLVFFHTKPGVDHVGIYTANGNFVHASTSKGVIISSLSSPYWNKRYWQTRRLGTGRI